MDTITLSKAQKHVVSKLENKSKLIAISKTWFGENAFFRNPDDSYERSNVKVIRTLIQKGILDEIATGHFLVREYTLNLEALAKVKQ